MIGCANGGEWKAISKVYSGMATRLGTSPTVDNSLNADGNGIVCDREESCCSALLW